MSKWTEKLPPDTIDNKEIMERLNLSTNALSKLRNEPFSTMPLPVNDDKKHYLYDREKMLEWIDQYLQMQSQGNTQSGLDNKLAQNFIRRS